MKTLALICTQVLQSKKAGLRGAKVAAQTIKPDLAIAAMRTMIFLVCRVKQVKPHQVMVL